MKSILIVFAFILILSNLISYYLGAEHARVERAETITETKSLEMNKHQAEAPKETAENELQQITFEGEVVDCLKMKEAKLLPEAQAPGAFGGTLAGSVNRAIVQVNQKIVRQKEKCGLTLTNDEKALLKSL